MRIKLSTIFLWLLVIGAGSVGYFLYQCQDAEAIWERSVGKDLFAYRDAGAVKSLAE